MANVLTDLAADIYKAADTVGREQVGFIPSVIINGDGSQAVAKGDTVRSHFTRAATVGNRSVAMAVSEGTDQTVDNKTVTITKDRSVEIPWTGEDIKHVNNGSGFETIYGDQIAQAMRAICNEMESDLSTEVYQSASRAYGTAGTTPFATAGDFSDSAFVRKILTDNGCPNSDMSLVLDTTAGATVMGKQAQANIAGGDTIQRNGILLPFSGLDLRQSAETKSHTKGTGSGYLLNDASSAVGDTTINVDTGTGTILAGDVVTFAGDTNKYVVSTALSGGSFTIGAPGLKVALTDNAAVTVGNSYTANVALHRNSSELVVRAPAIPVIGGVRRDSAVDRMLVTDPFSGLPFEISVYLGQGKAMIEVAAAWGVKAWKEDHIAILLG